MSKDNDTMKRFMEQALLQRKFDDVSSFFRSLAETCEENTVSFDAAAALEHWWSLARIGVIALPGASLVHTAVGWTPCHVLVTERGRKLLERGEQSPHDPPKYLDAVRRRVEKPDEIVLTYLDEAVGAWSAGLYRASSVMLGCACERLVLLLAEELVSTNFPTWSDKIQKKLKAEPVVISQVFNVIRDCLAQLSGERKLPRELADAVDKNLSPIFEHSRGLRNKSGHPTGAEVTSEEAEANLLLFPVFYGLVSDLCKHLRAENPTGAGA